MKKFGTSTQLRGAVRTGAMDTAATARIWQRECCFCLANQNQDQLGCIHSDAAENVAKYCRSIHLEHSVIGNPTRRLHVNLAPVRVRPYVVNNPLTT